MFVQAGAFRSPDNARRLVERIRDGTDGSAEVFVQEDRVGGQRIYRVRIGPVSGVDHFDRIVQQMTRIGIPDAYLALD
jgi:rare lipoprotein A